MRETRFKQTEIGEIPEDWEVTCIGDIADGFSYGVGAEAVSYNGVDKYIRITDIDDDSHQFSPQPLMSPAFYFDKNIVQKNDILLARTGASVGKTYLYNENDGRLIFAGFLMKVHVKEDSSQFVFYNTLLQRYNLWIQAESMRTGQPGINLEQLKTFKLPLPQIAEQERIAKALSDVDGLLRELDGVIAKKRAIKQGAMQELLTGKRRLEGFEGEWVEKKLGKIGFTFNGLTGKTSADFGAGQARYITFLNVLNNPVIDTTIFEKVDVKPTEKQNAVQKNDLFFNTSSETPEEVGTCSVLLDDVSNVYLNSFCFGYRLTDDSVSGLYLAYYFRCKLGRELMMTLAQGSTRYNLSKDQFLKSTVFLPNNKAEQESISKILSDMDEEIAALEAKRAKYEQLKQGMMQELLTGRIRLV